MARRQHLLNEGGVTPPSSRDGVRKIHAGGTEAWGTDAAGGRAPSGQEMERRERWRPSKGDLVVLAPGIDEKKGFRAREVGRVSYGPDDEELVLSRR